MRIYFSRTFVFSFSSSSPSVLLLHLFVLVFVGSFVFRWQSEKFKVMEKISIVENSVVSWQIKFDHSFGDEGLWHSGMQFYHCRFNSFVHNSQCCRTDTNYRLFFVCENNFQLNWLQRNHFSYFFFFGKVLSTLHLTVAFRKGKARKVFRFCLLSLISTLKWNIILALPFSSRSKFTIGLEDFARERNFENKLHLSIDWKLW